MAEVSRCGERRNTWLIKRDSHFTGTKICLLTRGLLSLKALTNVRSCDGGSRYLFALAFIFLHKFSFKRVNSHPISRMAEPSSSPILIAILGTPLQFLLSYVKGVYICTLSAKINFIIIQIGILLNTTPTSNSLSKASLSIGLNVLPFVLFGWVVLSVATNEDAWRPAYTSFMRLNC